MIKNGIAGLSILFIGLPTIADANYSLTILHFNDTESHTLNAGDPSKDPFAVPTGNASDLENYGGAARFIGKIDQLRSEAKTDGILTISAGDNIIPGLTLDASDPVLNPRNIKRVNYCALWFSNAKVDFSALGNHDFDKGPGYLEAWIGNVRVGLMGAIDGYDTHFASCNIDASAETRLAERVEKSSVFDLNGRKVGVIGATIWTLPNITDTGAARMIDADKDGDSDIDDCALSVQAEVDALTKQGVGIIILTSHLQGIRNEQLLIRKLRGVDLVVSGGGHELLVAKDSVTIPNASNPYGPYPLLNDDTGAIVLDLDGKSVPIVVAGSAMRYVGKLVANFDDAGNLLTYEDGPELVTALAPDVLPNAKTATADAVMLEELTKPVSQYVHNASTNVVATLSVPLDGRRIEVRNRETNLGDLVADAILYEARLQAAKLDKPAPTVAIVNGGGIRSDSVVECGTITRAVIKNILPFANHVAFVENVTPEHFKEIAENMVGKAGEASGRYGQISAFKLTYDLSAPSGARVLGIELDDGTTIVENGEVDEDAPTVSIATIDYLAKGNDGYPFSRDDATMTSIPYDLALEHFAVEILEGKITEKDYPQVGKGRIEEVNTKDAAQ